MSDKKTLTEQAKDRIFKKKIPISKTTWLEVRDTTARYIGDLSFESIGKIEEEMRQIFEVIIE